MAPTPETSGGGGSRHRKGRAAESSNNKTSAAGRRARVAQSEGRPSTGAAANKRSDGAQRRRRSGGKRSQTSTSRRPASSTSTNAAKSASNKSSAVASRKKPRPDADTETAVGTEIVTDEDSVATPVASSTPAKSPGSKKPKVNKSTTPQSAKRKRQSMEDQLKCLQYYHGMLTKRDIEPLFRRDGDFLLRKNESDSEEKCFTISVMFEDIIRHFVVRSTDFKRYYVDVNCFDTVADLVDYHQYSKVPLLSSLPLCLLKKAIRRPEWQLTHAQIKVGIRLGEGAYGEVFKGTLVTEGQHDEQPVAIKTMRQMMTTRDERVKFLKEARTMRTYFHPNLVDFLGVAVQEEPLMIVMEFCPGGSLQSYIIKMADKIDPAVQLQFCLEAAEGMAYLEKQGCIHRDIASRNCLIGKKNEVKIADFGLSRQMKIFKETTVKRVPIRWLAPETMVDKVYTSKTDVWSFGILLWEIFSQGQDPYPGLSNKQVREKVVKEKYRMAIPKTVPSPIDTVMIECWYESPEMRPKFKAVRDSIKKAL